MKLLNEQQLVWSTVVANCKMNRERKLTGVNSYKKDISFDVLAYLAEKCNENGDAQWIDICCGRGNALIEAEQMLIEKGLRNKVILEGLDLVNMFQPLDQKSQITFQVGAVLNWRPTEKYDLVTCVHGLHYIGDKLRAIEKIISSLKENGTFIGNIDLNNVRDLNNKSLEPEILKTFEGKPMTYHNRKKLLVCKGNQKINFNLSYKGADDKAGPNYTGQEVVNSIYS
ncbi:MAG: methyltransferase domain-containing protein [Bacteroidota bacterium]